MIGLELSPTVLGPVQAWTPRRLIAAYPGTQWFVASPGTVFTDTAGTTAADFGDGVGGLRVPGGAVIATQATSGSRPKYGRHPAGGIRNRANGSALTAPDAFWRASVSGNGITVTKVGDGVTSGGLPYVDYSVVGTATANAFLGITDPAATVATAVGQEWFVSLIAERISGSAPPISGDGPRASIAETLGVSTVGTATTGTALGDAVGPVTLVASRTNSQATADGVRGQVSIRVSNGETVDYVVRLTALQFERGAERTAYQANFSEFNITESGQRSVYYLQPDGSDDGMELVTPLATGAAYTLAAAHDLYPAPNATFDAFRGIVVGNASTSAPRFARQSASRLAIIHPGASNNRVFSTSPGPSVSGRTVDLMRISDTEAAWRNGVSLDLSSSSGSVTGAATWNALFQSESNYADGRFYAGCLVPAAITEAERLALQRYLAGRSGVTLA